MLIHSTRFVPTSDALKTAVDAGFRAAELQLSVQLLLDWESVAKLAQEFDVNYSLQFPNRLDVPDQAVENCAKLYRALDCRTLVIHEPMFERHVGRLLELDPSICLAVENSRFRPNRFDSWAENNEFLTLDVEHFWRFTLQDAPTGALMAQLERFLKTYGRKLRHVHLPGYSAGGDVHRPMYCSRDMVFAVLTLLAESNFSGSVVSEVSEQYQNRRDMMMDALLFESWQHRDELPASVAVRD